MRLSFYIIPVKGKKGINFYYKAWDGNKLRGDWPTYQPNKKAATIYCAKLELLGQLVKEPRSKRKVKEQQLEITLSKYAAGFWAWCSLIPS